ncbi:putative pyridine nucleotide-disulfide oxidoreductase [Rhexocercosporidium sp. MPI-PUGE-AT-0058]|nr:putative pyridine nucleotide-disulfide oxidoreductase [Rhexocercosporidium sp. MPI-PUGE-AT-0058]
MSPKTSRDSPVDVLIIGAGPAGLSCSSSLARLLHTCIVFSSESHRNQESKHMHGVLTWEHRDAADFRAAARKDILAHYSTTSFEDITISKIEKFERADGTSLFKATDEIGKEWWGRKVVLATGIKDIMPNIKGYDECWGSAIFHCLFCHGYEERGASTAGVLAMDDCAPAPAALHMARFANRLVQKVTIYTHDNDSVTKDIEQALSQCNPDSKTRKNVNIDSRKIAKFVKGGKGGEIEVHFEDGEKKLEGFLAHKPKGALNVPFVDQLGLEVTPQGDIKTTPPFQETSVRGVFAGGDSATPMKAATVALSAGGLLAAGIAAQLGVED